MGYSLDDLESMPKSAVVGLLGEVSNRYVSSSILLQIRYLCAVQINTYVACTWTNASAFRKRKSRIKNVDSKTRPDGYFLLNFAVFFSFSTISRFKTSSKNFVQETLFLKEKRVCDLRTVTDKLDITRRPSDPSSV